MQPIRMKMIERSAVERACDFGEVNLGYNNEQAKVEAKRCLQCKHKPCIDGCPVNINIPGFIKAIAENRMEDSIKILKDKNNLPAVCGRVCPQEDQCEKKCILLKTGQPIAIGYLERYAADWEKANKASSGACTNDISFESKVAVVGSGPAGLTCAGELIKMGFNVTIFESLHALGGVLRYGIPEFRLPKNILDYEIDCLKQRGVKIFTNMVIGRTKSVDELFAEGYDAVFLGIGAGLPKFMRIPGENLNNVYSANEFLSRVNLMNAYKFPAYDTPVPLGNKVVVIGGGNTALDSARTALRLGAKEVTLIYRRSRTEMPARIEEVHHAEEEGIKLAFLTDPIGYTGDENGFVREVECIKMELGEPDESGRRRPKPIQNSNFNLATDMVVIAVGLSPNPLLPSLTKGLEQKPWGDLVIDDNFMTTKHEVFAGGDIVGGETVIQAMGMGKQAAQAIKEYIFAKKSES